MLGPRICPPPSQFASWHVSVSPTCSCSMGLAYRLRQGSSRFERHSLDKAAFLCENLHILGHGLTGGGGEGERRRSHTSHGQTVCSALTIRHCSTSTHPHTHPLIISRPSLPSSDTCRWRRVILGGNVQLGSSPVLLLHLAPPPLPLCLRQ
ncbi:hypothetical protein QBC45DRAFT_74051 [Copromyces sp. CBS 386.78]|nr:hypothetical protein QBC45DRAFT_74051 [Copromyces sp. CBS 386.78]